MNTVATTIKVVITAKQKLFREGLRRILKDFDGVVITGEAADTQQSLELIAKGKPDVTLLDSALLDTNNLSFFRSARIENPATNILILCNGVDEKILLSAIEAGARGYLSTDSNISCLFNAILSVQQGELWIERKLITKHFDSLIDDAQKQPLATKKVPSLLTPREEEVLHYLAKGQTNKVIGEKLFISEKTVKSHLRNIFKKLNISSRIEAIMYSMEREGS